MITKLFPKLIQSLTNTSNVIIWVPPEAKLDTIASACALKLFLETQDTVVDLLSTQTSHTSRHPEIPHSCTIKTPDEYKQKTNTKSPLIICLNCAHDNTFLTLSHRSNFSQKIHITHNPKDNKHLCLSDIIAHLFFSSNIQVPKEVATILLAGILTKTNKLKHPDVQSPLLKRVGWLLNQGANRKKIVRDIYQKKCLNQTRFYGSLLGYTSYDMTHKILWVTPPAYLWKKHYKSSETKNLFDALYEQVPEDVSIVVLTQKNTTDTLMLLPKKIPIMVPKNTRHIVQKKDTHMSIIFKNSTTTTAKEALLPLIRPKSI